MTQTLTFHGQVSRKSTSFSSQHATIDTSTRPASGRMIVVGSLDLGVVPSGSGGTCACEGVSVGSGSALGRSATSRSFADMGVSVGQAAKDQAGVIAPAWKTKRTPTATFATRRATEFLRGTRPPPQLRRSHTRASVAHDNNRGCQPLVDAPVSSLTDHSESTRRHVFGHMRSRQSNRDSAFDERAMRAYHQPRCALFRSGQPGIYFGNGRLPNLSSGLSHGHLFRSQSANS